jgi:hypothetical protein
MNDEQRKKRNFRTTKKWKQFKKEMRNRQKVDYVTGKKLIAGKWQLHHLNMSAEEYEMLDYENFICLNAMTHKLVHYLYDVYKEDPQMIVRLVEILERMVAINKENSETGGK